MAASPRPSGEASRDASGVLVLGDGSSTLRLAIPKTLLAQIFAQVDRGFLALPHGGAEIGGLLVGPRPQGDNLQVEEAVPLEVEYQFGPVFRMSPTDRNGIGAAVATVQQNASKTVLGFFRSDTGGDQKLRDSDRQILEAIEETHASFADFHCCLMLARLSSFEMSLRLLARHGDNWEPVHQITVRRLTVRQDFTPVFAGAEPSPQPIADSSGIGLVRPPVTPSSLAARPPAGSLIQRNIALYAAIGLALLLAADGVYRWIGARRLASAARNAPTELAPTGPHLGFAANWVGPTWKLTWDRDAVSALKPMGATLSIQDGPNQQEIALTPADLSSGSLYYSPQTGALAFRLQVQRNGVPSVDERVRVLESVKPVANAPDRLLKSDRPAPLPLAPLPPRASTQGTAPPPDRLPAPSSAANFSAPPATKAAISTTNKPPAAPAIATPSTLPDNSQTRRVFADPSATAPAAPKENAKELASASVPAPPPLPVTALAVPVLPIRNTAISLPPSPAPQVAAQAPSVPAAQPPSVPATQPATATKATTAPNPPPAGSKAARPPAPQPTYVGPRPIKQVTPVTPRGIALAGPTQVEVRVAIDAKGKVTKITPVSVAANLALVGAAVKAAGYWEFDPARENGNAVPSEMTLIFRF